MKMAKRSYISAIKAKSTTAYPLAGSSGPRIHAVHALQKGRFAPQGDLDEKADRSIDGGYTDRRTCPDCYTRYSVNGSCNC